jgi:uncharacterized membrane protein YedE/YeeE
MHTIATDSTTSTASQARAEPELSWLAHVAVGAAFGIVLSKAEVISWFRIQEMFRFQSFHMYGVIGSAIAVGALSLFIIRRSGMRTMRGGNISIAPKDLGRGFRVAVGGTLFGLGWGLTGACPGPIFALIGNGVTVMIVVLASALAGTWVYGHIRHLLPH